MGGTLFLDTFAFVLPAALLLLSILPSAVFPSPVFAEDLTPAVSRDSYTQEVRPDAKDDKGELAVTDGLAIVTERSNLVRVAAYNPEIASADVDAARAGFYPSIDASVGEARLFYQPGAIFGSVQVPMANKSSFSYAISIKQTIYDFGAIMARYKESMLSADTARLDLDRTKNLVALNYLYACFDLLETEKMILVAQTEIKQLRSHKDTAGHLYEEGAITKNDLLAAGVKLSDAVSRLLSLKNQRELYASRINSLLMKPLPGPLLLVDDTPALSYIVTIEEYWLRAEKDRIELKVADLQTEGLTLEEKIKKAGYYPKFYVLGGFSFAQNDYQVHEDNWSIFVGADVNLFNGGRTKAEVARVRHSMARTADERKRILDDIRLEVQKSYLELKNSAEKLDATAEAVTQGEENLRITRARYEEGEGTATEVLDAIALKTLADTNHYRAMFDYKRARAALLYSSGTDVAREYATHVDNR
ncbi:MAG: TolC family protein [Nitrospirae bacterium]|nr:TolC family protein [Nitrospirota bacterium]